MNYEKLIKDLMRSETLSRKKVHYLKTRFAKENSLDSIPLNSVILEQCSESEREKLLPVLRKKPMRTISGVAPVAVMTSPSMCPHGTCVYCPGGPATNSAKSYTGFEPAALRARQNAFDPFKQTVTRLEQYELGGHSASKCEVIIMGGTFLGRDKGYQHDFVKGIFDGLNGFVSSSLSEAQAFNETAKHRCVGLTIETKPDYCLEEHVDAMLDFGTTRVELGVQLPDDESYELTNRGHSLKDTIDATRIAKDSAYKLVYHCMPGLPGSTPEKDVELFKKVFTSPEYKPDMLKIYPTLVMPGTSLHTSWKKGEFKPYDTQTAVNVISEFMTECPRWVRVMRMQRDIPLQQIAKGVEKSNLTELVNKRLEELGRPCQCIRCREIGHKVLRDKIEPAYDSVKLNRIDYDSSDGKEVFLSFDEMEHDALIGFIRLRVPSKKAHRPEIKDFSAGLIRELHVYGQELPLGDLKTEWSQHKGFGKKLLLEAERIARDEFGLEKLVIISGIGVREYYKKFGYELDGPYMSKNL